MLAQSRSDALHVALRLVAPGTPLREGIDRILQANMGALILVGDGPEVLAICSGGFLLSELAKMDGAIILAADGSRVARANVHLVPDPDIPTSETGTRHRTAERVARQIDVPVIAISEEMSVVTVRQRNAKKTLERIPRVLARADQALQILGRYKVRLDTLSGSLSALEVEDLVTVRDVAETIQRAEMVRRIAEEIEGYVIELGADGRLVQLQLEELIGGVENDLRLVCADYVVRGESDEVGAALERLYEVDDDDLIDGRAIPGVLNLPREADLDSSIQPRGYRLLAKIPRLPDAIVEKIVERFSSLPKLMRASIADLVEVEGVGEARARAIKDGLSRIAESSILERYA
jgi:diadenylate cyclase